MKIWYGFASNHSTDYEIVARFRSPAKARVAMSKIEDVANIMYKLTASTKAEDIKKLKKIMPAGAKEERFFARKYKHPVEPPGVDWEDPPNITMEGPRHVVLWVNTAGSGIDDLGWWFKKLGAFKVTVYEGGRPENVYDI